MQSVFNDTGHDLFQVTNDEDKLETIRSVHIFDHVNRCTDVNFLTDHISNLVVQGDIKIKHKSEVEQPWNGWFSSVKKQFQKIPTRIDRNPLNNFTVRSTLNAKNDIEIDNKHCDMMFNQIQDLLDSVIQLKPEDKVTIIACTVTETGYLNVSALSISGEQFMLKTKMKMVLRGYIIELLKSNEI